MSFDAFRRNEVPTGPHPDYRLQPGAESGDPEEQAEELIAMDIAQGARNRRAAIRRVMRTAQRAEVLAVLKRLWAEESGGDDPAAALARKVDERLRQQPALQWPSAFAQVKAEEPDLVARYLTERDGVPSRPAVDASTLAAEVFEAALREGCTSQQARDAVNGDRRLVEAVDRQWQGRQLGDTEPPVNEARRVIAPALGLPATAPLDQIAGAFDDLDDDDLPRIAAALRLPAGAGREDIKRSLERFLRTAPGDDQPTDDDPDQPVAWSPRHRPADKRADAKPADGTELGFSYPTAVRGRAQVSARARLHALAERRALETKREYGAALRDVVAEEPGLFQSAQAEYYS